MNRLRPTLRTRRGTSHNPRSHSPCRASDAQWPPNPLQTRHPRTYPPPPWTASLQNALICNPLPKWPLRRANALPTKIVQTSAPSHKHGTITGTIQLAPTSQSLKGPLARDGPLQSQISTSAEGALRKRTDPQHDTVAVDVAKQPHCACAVSGAPPTCVCVCVGGWVWGVGGYISGAPAFCAPGQHGHTLMALVSVPVPPPRNRPLGVLAVRPLLARQPSPASSATWVRPPDLRHRRLCSFAAVPVPRETYSRGHVPFTFEVHNAGTAAGWVPGQGREPY